MSYKNHDLLISQLRDALDDGDAVELMALAGLIARHDADEPLLAQVRSLPVTHAALAEAVDAVLEAVRQVDEDDDASEIWDALCQVDELAAALVFVDHPDVHSLINEAVGLIAAFPESWAVHARAATELIERGDVPFEDPAHRLWAAVEASRFGLAEDPNATVSAEVRIAAGFDVVIQLWPVRLAAAGTLPEPARWERLAKTSDWELALTTSPRGEHVLVLAGAAGSFERDGERVAHQEVDGHLVTPSTPGRWLVRIGQRELRFETRA